VHVPIRGLDLKCDQKWLRLIRNARHSVRTAFNRLVLVRAVRRLVEAVHHQLESILAWNLPEDKVVHLSHVLEEHVDNLASLGLQSINMLRREEVIKNVEKRSRYKQEELGRA